ncbi:hypothetical protein [Nocardioides pinisoli]|uniref:DUF3995 domain-containing protein n=1 Tax=Nocardioides pinisoli TaxID=2950279 RepID=A0ABT1KWP4_9ACTN|nr:hypothetical protein [Nocardioides pinisoli]MCP3422188.1 hypothetical protein [Nocardioides pinisoli]
MTDPSVRRGRPRAAALPTAGEDTSATASQTAVAAAWSAAALLTVVAAFHAAVAAGAPWGDVTQGGGTSGTLDASGRVVAGGSCVLTLVVALAVLGRAGRGPLARRGRTTTVLAWVATVYAAVGVVLNLVTRSSSERTLWAPVSALLLLLVIVVMAQTRPRGTPRTG